MTLIPIKEYKGSLVGEALLEGLSLIGVLNILNKHKYIINILDDGISNKKGYIDDDPDRHKIIIAKQILLGDKKETSFITENNEIDRKSNEYKEAIEMLESYRLKLKNIMGGSVQEFSDLVIMDSERVYYEHKIEIAVSKRIDETAEEYIERLFKFIADTVTNSSI